ncbi:unnamed protein product [Lactuca virosa]|uniref:Uncharacterized protein n=1 Tax=Lactuca virosa TaxID=75947 RepID=A0AAU9NKG9_9ASTR|nr:unnamed protein product [Lactuca virosa]
MKLMLQNIGWQDEKSLKLRGVIFIRTAKFPISEDLFRAKRRLRVTTIQPHEIWFESIWTAPFSVSVLVQLTFHVTTQPVHLHHRSDVYPHEPKLCPRNSIRLALVLRDK